jgi:hypothetical protein
MKAFGNGKPADLPAAEALDIAKGATPEPTKVDQSDPSELKAGQTISVVPDDTGKVPVSGTLVGLAPERVSIIRSDPRLGDVVVHFPRAGHHAAIVRTYDGRMRWHRGINERKALPRIGTAKLRRLLRSRQRYWTSGPMTGLKTTTGKTVRRRFGLFG